ncbi:MAG: hypothetical protein QOJ35_3586 [Solirubrobacteraceae bacterium]|jgi:hypothetical protein|nr:hypothetical protein [Solirubrobacteraceae bacterium]
MWRSARLVAVGVLAAGLVACGAARSRGPSAAGAVAPLKPASSLAGSCAGVARGELTDVARRIYAQAVHGAGVVTAVKRLRRTTALAAAVASGDRRAVRAAFLPIRHQIVRIELFDRSHLLYSFGRHATFAPIRGRLYDAQGHAVGHFVLAVTDRRAYAALVKRLTGAAVAFRTGPRRPAHGTVVLPTRNYPSGPLKIDVRLPATSRSLCGSTPQVTRANTIGYVGRRLVRAEHHSADVTRTLRHVARDPAFRRATAANDPRAIRTAIVDDFFRDHSLHVVRVRVMRRHRLVYDLGGPYALEPATGIVRSPDGRTAARFALAVQDDTGYIKLMHRFTGADVQLVSPLGKVPGSTLEPGPDLIPAHGTLTYRGRRYLASSFDATAFPSGTLRVSLLVPLS